jgi:hypothetical protein
MITRILPGEDSREESKCRGTWKSGSLSLATGKANRGVVSGETRQAGRQGTNYGKVQISWWKVWAHIINIFLKKKTIGKIWEQDNDCLLFGKLDRWRRLEEWDCRGKALEQFQLILCQLKWKSKEDAEKGNERGQLDSVNGFNDREKKTGYWKRKKDNFASLTSTNLRHLKMGRKVLWDPSELSCIGRKRKMGEFLLPSY